MISSNKIWIIFLALHVNLIFLITLANGQNYLRLSALPLYGWSNSSTSPTCYSFGIKAGKEKLGFNLNYSHSYKTAPTKYYYNFSDIHADFSYRFAHKTKTSDKEIGNYLKLGYNRVDGYKYKIFNAVDLNLNPPDWNANETIRYYNNFVTDVHYTDNYVNIGYERVVKAKYTYGG